MRTLLLASPSSTMTHAAQSAPEHGTAGLKNTTASLEARTTSQGKDALTPAKSIINDTDIVAV
jgi:hypothetical protein